MSSALLGGAIGLAKTVNLDFLGLGNNRDSKRANRSKYQKALRQMGVSAGKVDNVHSDDWKELKKLAEWVQGNGQPAVDYLNETMPAHGYGGKKGPTFRQVTSGFSSWNKQRQRQQAASGASGSGSAASGSGSAASGSGTKASGSMPLLGSMTSTGRWIVGLVVALILGYVINQGKI